MSLTVPISRSEIRFVITIDSRFCFSSEALSYEALSLSLKLFQDVSQDAGSVIYWEPMASNAKLGA